MKKSQCPFTKSECIRDKCGLWVSDFQKVTNLKDKKTGIKDSSACAIKKLGEQAAMNIWNETEKLINQKDKHCGNCGKKDWCKAYEGYGENPDCEDWIETDPYKHCSRNPLDSCPYYHDGDIDLKKCKDCEFYKE